MVNALAFQGTLCPELYLGPIIHPIIRSFSQQPAWGRSREFDITTRSVSRHGISQTTSGDLEDDEEEDNASLIHGRKKRKVAFMPSTGMVSSYPILLLLMNPLRHDSHDILP